MKPNPPYFSEMVREVSGVVLEEDHYSCIHAKTYLFDDDVVWLGSFNMDPRSVRLNTEVGVIIRNKGFFDEVGGHIRRQGSERNAWVIGPRRKIPVVAFFNGLIENIFSLIPIFNIWPFTYATSFELSEGGTPVPFFYKRFHDNYRPVGQFPGANVSVKGIKTRLTKAFFGPAEPII